MYFLCITHMYKEYGLWLGVFVLSFGLVCMLCTYVVCRWGICMTPSFYPLISLPVTDKRIYHKLQSFNTYIYILYIYIYIKLSLYVHLLYKKFSFQGIFHISLLHLSWNTCNHTRTNDIHTKTNNAFLCQKYSSFNMHGSPSPFSGNRSSYENGRSAINEPQTVSMYVYIIKSYLLEETALFLFIQATMMHPTTWLNSTTHMVPLLHIDLCQRSQILSTWIYPWTRNLSDESSWDCLVKSFLELQRISSGCAHVMLARGSTVVWIFVIRVLPFIELVSVCSVMNESVVCCVCLGWIYILWFIWWYIYYIYNIYILYIYNILYMFILYCIYNILYI